VLDSRSLYVEFGEPGLSADDVERVFRDKDIAMAAPRRFNYAYLASFGQTEIQGRKVPYLLFARQVAKDRPPALAFVYVLSERNFDLQHPPSPTYSGSRKHTEVFKENPDVSYLVVHSADSLNVFTHQVSN
jgi:hypothetical protein